MNHIKKFTENLETEVQNSEDRKQRKNSDPVSDRKEIVQSVIDCLVKDQNNHPGYQSFREELEDFLSTFPKE